MRAQNLPDSRLLRIIATLLLLVAPSAYAMEAKDPHVEWTRCQGPYHEVLMWAIDSTTSTCRDEISFGGGLGNTYSNSCVAFVALGEPYLVVDSVSRHIELRFTARPVGVVCFTLYDPVCGLNGEFGPLQAGEWVFFCQGDGFGPLPPWPWPPMPPMPPYPYGQRPFFMVPFTVYPVTDISDNGTTDAVDVQLVINGALGLEIPPDIDPDANGDREIDAVDVQLVINGALERV